MDLFDYSTFNSERPLADRMRPTSLESFYGQKHIVGKNSLLRRAISIDRLGSCIFYGPPGTGKTSLANIIAATTNGHFEKLNAVSAGVADCKRIIDESRVRLKQKGIRTYLLLDECHRWNKTQSDSLLGAIEAGEIIFIGSTTENPYVAMTKAIVSRCRIFEFRPLTAEDVTAALQKAIDSPEGLGNYNVICEDGVLEHYAWASGGDLRTAFNALELAVLTTPPTADNRIVITKEIASQSIQKPSLSVDNTLYYDMISAFCKSLRGSDSDAALFWSERLIQAGCDPLLIIRRLMVHSAEDVGMADPMALVMATSALTAYQNLGYPEGRIPLAEAIIYVCEASKSPSVVDALGAASEAAINSGDAEVPLPLREAQYNTQKISGYKYPHQFGGWVEQQYLPDKYEDAEFYTPSSNGYEKTLIRAKKIKKNKG